MEDIFKILKERARRLWDEHELLQNRVVIRARPLTVEEAIGNPEARDFPLQKGREKLMQAEFMGSYGQAYTDQYGNFEGSLEEILGLDLKNNFTRAVFVATLNAVLRHLGLIEGTVHCKDEGPWRCAEELRGYIKSHYGVKTILQVGYQPRMVESLSSDFKLRVVDLDPGNVGKKVNNILIQGPADTPRAVKWADMLVVTGTTLVNGTIGDFFVDKPVIFYGTTIAGAAHLMGWERFCACSL